MPIQFRTKSKTFNFIMNYFMEVMNLCTSHGLKHIVHHSRQPAENIMWLLAFCSSLITTVLVGNHFWSRLADRPTIISIERDRFSWNTTFPTITLCPHWQVNTTALEDFASRVGITNTTLLENFLRKLSEFDYMSEQPIDLPPVDELPSYLYAEALASVAYRLRVRATTGDGVVLREKRVMLKFGICYMFNSVIAHELPYSTGPEADVSDLFEVQALDNDAFAQILEMDVGYNLYVHSPQELPTKSGVMECPILRSCFFIFRAQAMTCAERTKRLTVDQRKCRLPNEPMDERYETVYSHGLCKEKAVFQQELKICGCVMYFYASAHEMTCDVRGMRCLQKNRELIQRVAIGAPCLPNCEDTHYSTHSVQHVAWFQGSNLRWELVSAPRVRFRRQVMFSTGDMLVSWGSTAGLFLGCSLLTFAEAIYFLTLKIFWRTQPGRASAKRRLLSKFFRVFVPKKKTKNVRTRIRTRASFRT